MSELERYHNAIAQIFRDPEATASLGTGMLISNQGYVLTCWHVVQLVQGGLPEKVYVRFGDQERVREAEVLKEHAAEILDYVVLKVEGQPPTPIPFGPAIVLGAFSSFGYRQHELFGGLGATGEMLARTLLKPGQVPRIQLKSGQVGRGMSGAPVWSETERRVVGLMSESYVPEHGLQDADLAFAVPIDAILQHAGMVGEQVGLIVVEPHRPRNPFIQRGAIREPKLFIGRKHDIETVSALIDQGSKVAIIGPAQSGKSSLLRTLHEQYKAAPHRFTVFVDMNRITSPKHFYTWLSYAIVGKAMDAVQFDAWADDTRHLLLFIDDYHAMAVQKMREIATYLRGLGQAPNKVIVITSLLSLAQLYPAHEYGLSNPGTIFNEYTLTPFDVLAARELIQVYLQGTGVHFTEQEIKQGWQNAMGSPYRLQVELEALFESKVSRMS